MKGSFEQRPSPAASAADDFNTCSLCGELLDFGPSVEAFELEQVICCTDCAEEIIQAHSQFGVGA